MPKASNDPFELKGKNVQGVIPQVLKNIEVQRRQIKAEAVMMLVSICLIAISPGNHAVNPVGRRIRFHHS